MITAGIDPGYDRLGVAIFKKGELILSTCLTSNPKDDFPTRLLTIGTELNKIFKDHAVNSVAVEELFFSKNQTTAMKVAEVRGLIMYLAGAAGAKVYQYSPQAIKLSVAGYGNAPKEQVTLMTKRLVKLETTPKYDDEYDAIAVALTHLAHHPK
ncbi:MAG: crossover junction endodeoxyribonuclease RuvC [Candidatus Pacebacteria bacterium]|nr:crossover junction endodeoxyribonuclease RuvC [Candidatus Paceibacterota bacterium]